MEVASDSHVVRESALGSMYIILNQKKDINPNVAQIFIKMILLSDIANRVCIYCCIMRQIFTNIVNITPTKH